MSSEDRVINLNSIEDIKDSILLMNNRLEEAFILGDIEGFMKWFKLDTVSDYYMRRWFTGYGIKVESPSNCIISVNSFENKLEDNFSCELIVKLTYSNHCSEVVRFNLLVKSGNEDLPVKIIEAKVSLIHPEWQDVPKNKITSDEKLIRDKIFSEKKESYLKKKWWELKELIDISCQSTDYLRASLYARAIPKTVRFRNTHPEIDSAAILSDMMSYRAARLAFLWRNDDLPTQLKKMVDFGQEVLIPKSYDDIRGDHTSFFPARELSLLPLYNFDESFAIIEMNGKADVSCAEISSFYASLLRLGGINPQDLFVVIQPFHYLTIFKLPKGYYIISLNEVMPMKVDRLYGDTEVNRVVTPTFFIDGLGQTNMASEVFQKTCDFFKNGIPIFKMPTALEKVNVLPIDIDHFPTSKDYDTPERLNYFLIKYVFEMSKKYPESPFTWAKYSYQTLMVSQPQVYIIWSLKSMEIQQFSKEYNSIEEIISWIKENVNIQSIFEEYHRIMTADQILRWKRGNDKDKALFLYSLVKSADIVQKGGVIITTKGSYTLLCYGEGYDIIDSKTLNVVPNIIGEILISFDEKSCLSRVAKQVGKAPDWIDLIKQA